MSAGMDGARRMSAETGGARRMSDEPRVRVA